MFVTISRSSLLPGLVYPRFGSKFMSEATSNRRNKVYGRQQGRGAGKATTDPEVLSRTPKGLKPQPKPRLTHFLSLPIGHHAELRSTVSRFTSALLRSDPAIAGFDETIVILPRRFHFTLGVMSLDLPSEPSRTLDRAKILLMALRPRVLELLDGHKLRAGLERMDILKPERDDPGRAHILYAGPDLESDDARRLRAVGELVQKEFINAGLVVDEHRPLTLHCTMINTVYRRPRTRGPRQPFSYASIVESAALRAIAPSLASSSAGSPSEGTQQRARQLPPISVKLGTWDVDEIQICEMGSSGPEGEYIRVAGCSLV